MSTQNHTKGGQQHLTRGQRILSWILQIIPAVIFLPMGIMKITGNPNSVMLFEQLGMEPLGRFAVGIAEIAAGVLLLWSSKSWLGGLVGMGVLAGAIFFHLTSIGIVMNGDGGMMFMIAIATFLMSAAVVWLRRHHIPVIGPRLGRPLAVETQ
jgi:uncharacterized membrane protein YphA (DoxX/SURF4 family)